MKEDKVVLPASSDTPVIAIKGLKKSFGSLSVLNGIDIDIQKGENVAILGRSGSGKSVLIKIISGLLKPDAGIVQVLGQEVAKISEKELYLISKNGIISDIASVNVIKGIEALKKYPEDGKKVVYEITLKNNSKPNF